jgi:hypothetical protein
MEQFYNIYLNLSPKKYMHMKIPPQIQPRIDFN